MSNTERTLSPAARRINQVVMGAESSDKPKPPADLWKKMDQLMQTHVQNRNVPPNAFTRKEFQAQYSISSFKAHRYLKQLMNSGVIKLTKSGRHAWYTLVETTDELSANRTG